MNLDWVLLGLRILGTVILYAFLGFAFYIIWRDLKLAEAQIVTQSHATDQLRVIDASGDGSLVVGETFLLQPMTLLGRDPENTIVVNDASASAQHARLSRKNGVWWLEDLGSANGTRLNQLPLSKPAPLTNGDIIEMGNVCFRLETGAK